MSDIEQKPVAESDVLLASKEEEGFQTNGKIEIIGKEDTPNRDHTFIRVRHRMKSNHLTQKRTRRYVQDCSRSVFSRDFIFRHLPCLDFARNYNLDCLTGDLIAGLTTALTVIPQGIGYAPLAGLPLQFGLYASILPGFVYAILGTCKEATVGPTAVNSLMSFTYAGSSIVHAVTLAFFTGIIQIVAGFLNLGFLINFISAPVISAFTSAVSIQVATSQVKGLLGLRIPGRGFVNTWVGVFSNIQLVRPCDASVGFACIGILLFLRKLKDFRWCEGADPETGRARVLRKLKWLISVSRNCLVVILSTAIAYLLSEKLNMKDALILTGDVEAGIPAFQLPWQFNQPSSNGTGDSLGPLEIAQDLNIGLVMVSLVALLQHVAVAKFYAPPSRKVDASQELIALGASTFLGSFVGSMSITASFGRSAVNGASGVRTPFGGIVTGVIILLACAFLTPHFAFIPTSALSAVIISAMIFTIEIEILLPMWKSKKMDLIPFSLTFFLGLFWSVEMGMIVGTITHLCILLYSSSQPKFNISNEKIDNVDYILVTPDRSLYFPAVDEIRTRLGEAVEAEDVEAKGGQPTPIIFDLELIVDMDFTAARAIRAMGKAMKKNGQPLYFCGAAEHIEYILQGADPSLFLSYGSVEEAEQRVRGS